MCNGHKVSKAQKDVVVTVCVDCGSIDVDPSDEYVVTKLSMSKEEWTRGHANIMIDGEIHTFERVHAAPIVYWIDFFNGSTYDDLDFDIFDI